MEGSAGASSGRAHPDEEEESKLGRSSSWRRFKEGVKEKVQGWVGGPKRSSEEDEECPSAVNPSRELQGQSIDVDDVLHGTNCYGARGGGGANSRRRKSEFDAHRMMRHQQRRNTEAVPQIVVTNDQQQPVRPARRASANKAHEQAFQPMLMQQQHPQQQQNLGANATPRPGTTRPMDIAPLDVAAANRRRSYGDLSATDRDDKSSPSSTASVGSMPTTPHEEAELKKRIAVMKIKQAILDMNQRAKDDSALMMLRPQQQQQERRRNSDITAGGEAPPPPTAQIERLKLQQQHHRQNAASEGSSPVSPPSPSNYARRKSAGHALTAAGAANRRRPSAADSNSGGGANVRRASSLRKPNGKAPAKKPMIWEHFDAVAGNSLQGRCRACRMAVSCKYNTGNFVRHLQVAHMDIYRQYQNKIETQWTRSMIERNLNKR